MIVGHDPHGTARATLSALDRLARSLAPLPATDVDAPSRAIGICRRTVAIDVVGRVDRAVAALHRPLAADGRAPADPTDAARLSAGDGHALAAGVAVRRGRLANAIARTLGPAATRPAPDDVCDELEALLARVELAHVALDLGYDVCDLPPASIAACARVADVRRSTHVAPRHDHATRSTARRRRGIPWPRGRPSS